MRLIHKRCSHCRVVYSYQASGHGCDRKENSAKWCPDCAVIAKDALCNAFEKVLVKHRQMLIKTDEVTAEELLDARQQRIDKVEKEGGLWCERVLMCLHDQKNPDNHNRRYVIGYNDRTYYLSYWQDSSGEKTGVEIEVEMELNVETGKTIPWRYYD